MKLLVFFFIMIFMLGCANVGFDLKPNDKLSTQSYSISITGNGWWTGQEIEDRMLKFQGMYDRLWFSRHLPNMMNEDVRITISSPENQNINFLLDKKRSNDLERTRALPPTEWEIKNLAERGVAYNKHYVDYISGLKCTTNVESSNIAQGVGHTKYYTVCGYYNLNGAKKRIDIFYDYTYTNRNVKFESDKTSSKITPQEMDMQFKQDMKAIFDSLEIHDMDRKRMKEEGLLHDKKYEIQKW